MDFTEFDRKFAKVDRNFKQEYRVLARINHDGCCGDIGLF